MATLEQIVAQGKLEMYHAELEPSEQPQRYIYAAPEFVTWFTSVLSVQRRDRDRNLTPLEQVEEGLAEFVRGDPLAYGQDCKKLDPAAHAVWELRTTDVRIFGWFPKRSIFLMVCGEMKVRLQSFKSYAPYISKVASFRNSLPLDNPKAMTGDLRDVI